MEIKKIAEKITETDMLLDLPPLDKGNNEERSIMIPLFIPESAFNVINKDGNQIIEDLEYMLDRKYENEGSTLWKQFNQINFEFIPVKVDDIIKKAKKSAVK